VPHHLGHGGRGDGLRAQLAESVDVERGDADVVRPVGHVEVGQLDHGRDVAHIQKQSRQRHQRDDPPAADQPPDQCGQIGQQDDRHQQGDRSPEPALFRRNERRAPAQHGGGKQQSSKDDSQKIEQTKDGFSTHFVLSCNDLCVQI